jgi:hypothetical protein
VLHTRVFFRCHAILRNEAICSRVDFDLCFLVFVFPFLLYFLQLVERPEVGAFDGRDVALPPVEFLRALQEGIGKAGFRIGRIADDLLEHGSFKLAGAEQPPA